MVLATSAGALLSSSCSKGTTGTSPDSAPALLHQGAADEALEKARAAWTHVPVPPEDGPRLASTSLVTPIYEQPRKSSEPIGYLRVGAKVARSEEPVGREACPGGWYAVRPVGFVCANEDATLKLDHPVVRAIDREPDRSKPLPYKYAFLRSIAPNYLRVPNKDEQFKYEMRLERHIRNYAKLSHKWDALEVGSNDVPLSESGAAIGGIPDHAKPMDFNERFGGDGDDELPWWLEGERRIPNLSTFKAPPYAVIAGRIKRHAGVALIDTFVTDEKAQKRRFAVSTDGRLIPADKLKADSGSPFHGYEIGDVGLPVAFAYDEGTRYWSINGGKLARGEKLKRRQMVPLSGRVMRPRGVRMVETRDGKWLRSQDLKVAAKPSELPWFAHRGVNWVDISIFSQTLVLWEGDKPVYATLTSTGRDGIGEPGKTLSTPQGTFRIYQKHVTTTMDSDVADSEFELRDVPWVMYFKGGYAIHAAYWHDDFGHARSHGCVNLSPVDARYVFEWASPQVPDHWHAAYSGDAMGEGTLVHIHK